MLQESILLGNMVPAVAGTLGQARSEFDMLLSHPGSEKGAASDNLFRKYPSSKPRTVSE